LIESACRCWLARRAELGGVAFWSVLGLLIDTSAWVDLATRRHGQKWIVPLRVLKFQGKLDLLVPSLIIEEFDRNRPQSESAVTTSVLDRLRWLRRELREYVGDKHEHVWLAEIAQHILMVNATAPQNFREIDELLRGWTILEPAESEYWRAVQRGLNKQAPFTSDKNSVADALLIEIYTSQLSGVSSPDVYASVASNYQRQAGNPLMGPRQRMGFPRYLNDPDHRFTLWAGCLSRSGYSRDGVEPLKESCPVQLPPDGSQVGSHLQPIRGHVKTSRAFDKSPLADP
jgi:PIN domain